VNRYLSLVSSVFRWACRREYVRENPCQKIERESERGRGREVYLSASEAAVLLARAPATYHPLILAAISTGMRAGELLGLTWADVDLGRREVTVRAEVAKTKRTRTLPLTEDLCTTLADLSERRPVAALDASDRVFCHPDGAPITYPALRTAWDALKRACRGALPEAKRPRLRFHDLRHTAASLMVAAGVPLFDVSKILGHATIQMTMRYAHFCPENARAGMERFGRAVALLPKAAPSATGG
jgi:integrase